MHFTQEEARKNQTKLYLLETSLKARIRQCERHLALIPDTATLTLNDHYDNLRAEYKCLLDIVLEDERSGYE